MRQLLVGLCEAWWKIARKKQCAGKCEERTTQMFDCDQPEHYKRLYGATLNMELDFEDSVGF